MATRNDTTNARHGASPTTYNDWLANARYEVPQTGEHKVQGRQR